MKRKGGILILLIIGGVFVGRALLKTEKLSTPILVKLVDRLEYAIAAEDRGGDKGKIHRYFLDFFQIAIEKENVGSRACRKAVDLANHASWDEQAWIFSELMHCNRYHCRSELDRMPYDHRERFRLLCEGRPKPPWISKLDAAQEEMNGTYFVLWFALEWIEESLEGVEEGEKIWKRYLAIMPRLAQSMWDRGEARYVKNLKRGMETCMKNQGDVRESYLPGSDSWCCGLGVRLATGGPYLGPDETEARRFLPSCSTLLHDDYSRKDAEEICKSGVKFVCEFLE